MNGQRRKYIFLVIQLILYLMFLTLDIIGRHNDLSTFIKFTVVLLCFFYVMTNGSHKQSKWNSYLRYALAITVVSDILILLWDYYLYGVLTFILTQQLYSLRIAAFNSREKSLKGKVGKYKYKGIYLRLLYQALLSALVCAVLWYKNVHINALLVVSIFYFISLSTNVVGSLKLLMYYRNRVEIMCFAIGMVLFLLCDINVGLFNLSEFLTLGSIYKIVYSYSSILMWTFYAPSQILIALSGDSARQVAQ